MELEIFDSERASVVEFESGHTTSAYSCTQFESPAPVLGDPSVAEDDLVRLPESLRVGDEYHVSATIRNLGSGDVDGTVVRLSVDGTPVADNVVSIRPGGQVETNFAWMATAGLHDFAIEIDPDNALEEIDETNNTVTWQVAAGLPDFRCRAMKAVPELPLPDTPISIIASIGNLGDDPDTNWLDVSLYADETLLEARTIDLRDIPYEAPLFTWDVTFAASLPPRSTKARLPPSAARLVIRAAAHRGTSPSLRATTGAGRSRRIRIALRTTCGSPGRTTKAFSISRLKRTTAAK